MSHAHNVSPSADWSENLMTSGHRLMFQQSYRRQSGPPKQHIVPE